MNGAQRQDFSRREYFSRSRRQDERPEMFSTGAAAFETTVKEAPESADRHANLGLVIRISNMYIPPSGASVCGRKFQTLP